MTDKDLEVSREFFAKAKDDLPGQVRRVLALSPEIAQMEMLRTLFPDAEITRLMREDYDMDFGPPPGGPYDVAFLGNVFMYCRNPGLWFDHLFASCRFLFVQDLVRAWRGGDQELGQDGDSLRFSFPSRYEEARTNSCFNPDEPESGVMIHQIDFYIEPTGHPPERACLKFVAVFERDIFEEDHDA